MEEMKKEDAFDKDNLAEEQLKQLRTELVKKVIGEKEYSVDQLRYQNWRAPKKKFMPNDPCPCGARREDGRPKKYKKCHMWMLER